MSSYIVTYSDELYHHGVKGMHWGVRRYQNKDGSLTSKGRKHYEDEYNKFSKKANKYSTKQTKGWHKYNEAVNNEGLKLTDKARKRRISQGTKVEMKYSDKSREASLRAKKAKQILDNDIASGLGKTQMKQLQSGEKADRRKKAARITNAVLGSVAGGLTIYELKKLGIV